MAMPHELLNLKTLPGKPMYLHNDRLMWRRIVAAFPILCENVREMPEKCDVQQFNDVIKMIIDNKLANIVTGYVINSVINKMNGKLSNEVWYNFMIVDIVDKTRLLILDEKIETDVLGFLQLKNAIDDIFFMVQSNMQFINRLELMYENTRVNIKDHYLDRVKAMLFSRLPYGYNLVLYNYFRTLLRVIIKDSETVSKPRSRICAGCHYESMDCHCDRILDICKQTNWQLNALGLMNSLGYNVLMNLMIKKVQAKADASAHLKELRLSVMEKWFDNVVYKWMSEILEIKYYLGENSAPQLDIFMAKLKQHLYKICGKPTAHTGHIYSRSFMI